MAALTSQSITTAGAAPSVITVAASDTIAEAQFGPNGCLLRVMNAGGTIDNVSISDPGRTASSNPGTVTPVAVPITTGIRNILIPRSAIDPTTGNATVAHSFITTVTAELYRI